MTRRLLWVCERCGAVFERDRDAPAPRDEHHAVRCDTCAALERATLEELTRCQ